MQETFLEMRFVTEPRVGPCVKCGSPPYAAGWMTFGCYGTGCSNFNQFMFYGDWNAQGISAVYVGRYAQ